MPLQKMGAGLCPKQETLRRETHRHDPTLLLPLTPPSWAGPFDKHRRRITNHHQARLCTTPPAQSNYDDKLPAQAKSVQVHAFLFRTAHPPSAHMPQTLHKTRRTRAHTRAQGRRIAETTEPRRSNTTHGPLRRPQATHPAKAGEKRRSSRPHKRTPTTADTRALRLTKWDRRRRRAQQRTEGHCKSTTQRRARHKDRTNLRYASDAPSPPPPDGPQATRPTTS